LKGIKNRIDSFFLTLIWAIHRKKINTINLWHGVSSYCCSGSAFNICLDKLCTEYTLFYTLSFTHTLFHNISLSLTHTHKHTHVHTLFHTLSFTHTRVHIHTFVIDASPWNYDIYFALFFYLGFHAHTNFVLWLFTAKTRSSSPIFLNLFDPCQIHSIKNINDKTMSLIEVYEPTISDYKSTKIWAEIKF